MAILGFKKRFAPKVKRGTKRQTIRAFRKYPIKVGETLYLYTGLRTKAAEKLLEVKCKSTELIHIDFREDEVILPEKVIWTWQELNVFAKADGFRDWHDLRDFWSQEHGPLKYFEGTLIKW